MRVFAARAHAGGLSPRSVQRRLSAVRGFFNYLVREKLVASNPAVDIRAPKAARRLPGTLDVDQLNHLLDIPPDDVRIGMPVTVTFDQYEDVWLPFFRPAS